MPLVPHLRRTVAPLGLAAALFALGASNAHAGLLVATAPDCQAQSSDQVFMPWADVANYFQAPGGNFESGAAGWSLDDGAAVGGGNEPTSVAAPADDNALALPVGSEAASPTVCVGLGEPTLRFFARRSSGFPSDSLRVDVEFEDASGDVHRIPTGFVKGGSSWALSPQIVVVANLLPLVPGEQTPVRFIFTPQGAGTWKVDDLYVDPWHRG